MFRQKNSGSAKHRLVFYMRQSWVENEHYSVAYFDRITALETGYLWTSVKGGAQMRCVNASIVAAFTQRKFRDITFQMQRRDQNTQRNKVRFLLGTATHVSGFVSHTLWMFRQIKRCSLIHDRWLQSTGVYYAGLLTSTSCYYCYPWMWWSACLM